MPADWHPEDIKAAIRKRGVTLAAIARRSGIAGNVLRLALTLPRAQGERIIADVLNVHPMVIWPSRYDLNGDRKRPQPVDNYRAEARFGNPASTVEMMRTHHVSHHGTMR